LSASHLGLKPDLDEWRGDHLFGLRLPHGVLTEEFQAELTRRKIHVSLRGNAVRISPHVYNDASDMGALLEALRVFLLRSR
jgi:selenocysteine lyase/cysteine desulfurase